MVEEQAQVPQEPDGGAEDPAEEAWRDAVEEHCDQFLGPCPNVIAETSSDLVRIDLDPYLPAHNRDRTTVVTVGVSTRATNAPDAMASYRRIELFTYLAANWTYGTDEAHWWPCRMLKDVGRLVHRYDTWYAPGQLLGGDAEEPLTDDSLLTGVVLLPPVYEDPAFDQLEIDGESCRFLWAFPLTTPEIEFAQDRGVSRLLELMAERDVQLPLDARRGCMVTGKKPGEAGASRPSEQGAAAPPRHQASQPQATPQPQAAPHPSPGPPPAQASPLPQASPGPPPQAPPGPPPPQAPPGPPAGQPRPAQQPPQQGPYGPPAQPQQPPGQPYPAPGPYGPQQQPQPYPQQAPGPYGPPAQPPANPQGGGPYPAPQQQPYQPPQQPYQGGGYPAPPQGPQGPPPQAPAPGPYGPPAQPPAAQQPPASAPPSAAPDPWSSVLDGAQQRLTRLLDTDGYLVVEEAVTGYYVQFASSRRRGTLVCEAVSNQFLPPGRRLSTEQEQRMRTLGWSPPGQGEASGSWNHARTLRTPVKVAGVARVAVTTLRDIYGCDPRRLSYTGNPTSVADLNEPFNPT